MPRRPYKKRPNETDVIFNSVEVGKFINYLMLDGKKTVSQKIIYNILGSIKKEDKNPLQILHQAINNVAPNYEVTPRRLGGASYLVPTEVRRSRKLFFALNWIIQAAKARTGKEYQSFEKKLLAEILDAAKNQGAAVNKKVQNEKLAEANKAFSHLKW